ncbi:MAG: hypothetical protein RMK30_04430 [Anaerolineae bacterium]|nr:hypothetical protein [Anaerolineae bacterium]MDW8102108.1 hypothetical protein [Anaerolineae bacterium]
MEREPRFQLSVMDGLKFGCGFYIAGFFFSIVMMVITLILLAILGLLGGGLGELFRQGF